MSITAIPGHLHQRRPVGDDILACAVLPGYLVLIEARVIDGDVHGGGPEVVAIATRSWPSEDGRLWEISWVGAVCGHDAPKCGIAFYGPRSYVTVLSRDLIEEVAA